MTAARAILRSDEFRQMRQVVMEESPVKRVVLPYGAAKPSHMARVYAEERGFQLAIRMLEMLGEPYSKGEDLPVTFPDPLENNDLL